MSYSGDDAEGRDTLMRRENDRKSENVEDRRGMGVSRGVIGGGIGTIIIVLVALYFGIDSEPLRPHSRVLPASYPSHIQVNKIGAGIIPHASPSKIDGSALQGFQFIPGDANIDGLSVCVQAVFCHSAARHPQE